MAIDFVVLLLFAMAGAVHSFFWEAHALLDGTLMYKTAAVIKRRIREERTSPELKNSKTFINEFLLAVFWRSIVFLAFLIAAHVPMELNWASSNLVAAWGIQMACVAVAWTLFYFLYEYLGTSNERARLKTLFNHDGELIPFTIFLCLANLLYVTAFFLVRHFGTVVYWEDQGWWVVPAASGAVLVALLYGIGQCVPLRHQIHSNRKLRRKMPA
jgi:hypothetical protein